MMENEYDNMRKHPRRYYSQPKDCSIRKSEDQPWQAAELLNISLGGAKLKPSVKMAKGDAFQIKVNLGQEIVISCVTVRVDDSIIGVSFALFDKEIANLIDEEVGNDANAYTQTIID